MFGESNPMLVFGFTSRGTATARLLGAAILAFVLQSILPVVAGDETDLGSGHLCLPGLAAKLAHQLRDVVHPDHMRL